VRGHQKPEHQEQDDLSKPGHSLKEMLEILSRGMLGRAGHHCCQIYRKKPAGPEELRETENRKSAGQHQHRCERGFEPQPFQRLSERPAAAESEQSTAGHLFDEQQCAVAGAERSGFGDQVYDEKAQER
jgi:hypothetical protein